MPIRYYQLTPKNNHLPGYTEAKNMAEAAIKHFDCVRHKNVGIGPGSCCAAFYVEPAEGFGEGIVFGNSQVAAGGLDIGKLGGHAERCAITAAGYNKLKPMKPAILFVELQPCPACQKWLEGNGGGTPNPYSFNEKETLLVWYAFPYPDGVQAMINFHNMKLDEQQHIASSW